MTKSAVSSGFVTFTEEILHGKLHFFYSENIRSSAFFLVSVLVSIYVAKYGRKVKWGNRRSAVELHLDTRKKTTFLYLRLHRLLYSNIM